MSCCVRQTKRCSVHNEVKKREKASNPQIRESQTRECSAFLLNASDYWVVKNVDSFFYFFCFAARNAKNAEKKISWRDLPILIQNSENISAERVTGSTGFWKQPESNNAERTGTSSVFLFRLCSDCMSDVRSFVFTLLQFLKKPYVAAPIQTRRHVRAYFCGDILLTLSLNFQRRHCKPHIKSLPQSQWLTLGTWLSPDWI